MIAEVLLTFRISTRGSIEKGRIWVFVVHEGDMFDR